MPLPAGPSDARIDPAALSDQLRALAEALGLSAAIRVPAADAATPDGDVHAAAIGVADRLLDRIAALTTLLQQESGPLTGADRLTARLLLADLSLVSTTWQAFGSLTGARLDAAAERLEAARHTLDRALRSADPA
jgi:hypothetical protein